MAESYIQSMFADRIGGSQFGKDTTLYKFAKIKKAKQEAKKAHPNINILDFGVGEPDDMAPDEVRLELKKQVDIKDNRFYTDNGISAFKDAVARYMQNIFNVQLDPDTQINHCIGEKSACALLPLTLINPGDIALMTVPGYPVIGTHTKYLGGEVLNLPLKEENQFFPDLKSLDSETRKRAKLLVINYPNNPTGKGPTRDFYKQVIDFAGENSIAVISDAAYSTLVYNSTPLSILSLPGGMDVALEMHSLSKSFNMTGWRIGWVCGNPLLVKAFAFVKDNADSGQFAAIQLAAAKALDNPELTKPIVEKYSRRLEKMVDILKNAGFQAKKPDGTFYLYVPSPKKFQDGTTFQSAEEFSQFFIKQKLISTVPWDDTGMYIRFSATFEADSIQEEEEMLKEFETRIKDLRVVE